MPAIKFTHAYRKLMDSKAIPISTAELIQVQEIKLEELHPAFLDYDTDCGVYALPKKGIFLMLIFLKKGRGEPANLFTTLRRYIPQKADYYKSQIGKTFDVIITKS